LSHAHDVEQQRGCEDGAAASDQSERKPDKRSRSQRGADHRDHGRAPFMDSVGMSRGMRRS
jgi:hypothetical protein